MKARQLIETVASKRIIQQALAAQQASQIDPGDDYYLNLGKVTEPWQDAEFCPVRVIAGNQAEQLDGMYGLQSDIAYYLQTAVGGRLAASVIETGYLRPIYHSLEQGITGGRVSGVLGEYRWRLVYLPFGHAFLRAQQVVVGRRYRALPVA